jgi:hypothetical protein
MQNQLPHHPQQVDWMKVLQAVSLVLGIMVAIRSLNE